MVPPINESEPSQELSLIGRSSMQALADCMVQLRAVAKNKQWKENASLLTELFKPEDPGTCKKNLLILLGEVDFTMAFTNAGIPQGTSFPDETFRILKGKILPYVYHPKDAEAVIHEICSDKGDYYLIAELIKSFPTYAQDLTADEKHEMLSDFRIQARKALEIISYRVAALGMDEEIYTRAGRNEELITPFMEQNREVNEFLKHLEGDTTDKLKEDLAQTRVMVRHCRENVALIDKAAERNGASLKQTFILRKLELLTDRMLLLLPVAGRDETDEAFADLIALLHEVVLAETNPRSLRDFIARNVSLIAYRITENKRKTGEHYIATDKSEYWDLFISACGGGFIVSLMVILKMAIHQADMPLFWESLLYALNYAFGFVIIHILHFTLATKQPAMTAAYIAASMDDIREDSSRYQHLSATIATMMRSQLVSFGGNLLTAFPFTLCWMFFIQLAISHPFVDAERADRLIDTVSPFTSFAMWYAAITGVWLFLAGIVSGFGDNKVIVSRIGARLEAHPWLKTHLVPGTLHKFSSYIEKNLGPLLGNIAFGLMLGFTTFLGKITGLPIDIRHVTFSAGSVAMGFWGVGFGLSWLTVVNTILGIIIIGVINFAVSFFLALQVAARSRGLRLKDYPDMIFAVLAYFRQHPAHFFYPPSIAKQTAEPAL